ncbi:YHYH domain-containing protein [Paenibacillus sp. NPDC058174]|uniref:YHYH domain-containing protein n=1 Tax=Paenibacillus sp. NPDC058174 TaxID=3346366 RepID=UPI0036DD2707
MQKTVVSSIILALLVTMLMPLAALAHSGRTDSNGGHNCSEKSKRKGLCTGYHYHNGGKSSGSISSSSSGSSSGSKSSGSTSSSGSKSSSSASAPKVKIIYNETAPYPHCKKVKDVYRSSSGSYVYYDREWDCNKYTEGGAVYTESSMSLYVNDKYYSLQQSFISIKDSSYIYIRDFSQAFGFEIELDQSKNVTLKSKDTTIKVYAESKKIYLNGTYTGFNAVKADGQYYLPFRASLTWAKAKIDSISSSAVYVSR